MSIYEPGVCNIGKVEIRKRYAFGLIGFILTIILAIVFISLNIYLPWSLLITIIPLVLGFEGIFQGKAKFCAGFAARGIYDFNGSGGGRNKVSSDDDHRKDLKKANRIHLYSVISGLIILVIILGINMYFL